MHLFAKIACFIPTSSAKAKLKTYFCLLIIFCHKSGPSQLYVVYSLITVLIGYMLHLTTVSRHKLNLLC